MECLELTYKKPKRYAKSFSEKAKRYNSAYRYQEWLDERMRVTKERLIRNYGYNEQSAMDVLNHVANKIARGE